MNALRFTAFSIIGAMLSANGTHGQVIQFSGGQPPIIATISVKSTDNNGRPTVIADAKTGRQFAATYDTSGRLIALKSMQGRSAFDIRALIYRPDGRLYTVCFGNQYQLGFRYLPNGDQAVRDNIGGEVIRAATTSGSFANKSVVDPSGLLVPSLSGLAGLFSQFPNATSAPSIFAR